MYQPPVNEFQVFLKALSYFRTHWWLFVLEVILIYGVSLHKFHKTPSVYDSDATLLIDTTRRQLYQSMMMSGASGANRIYAFICCMALLKSRMVACNMARLNLASG